MRLSEQNSIQYTDFTTFEQITEVTGVSHLGHMLVVNNMITVTFTFIKKPMKILMKEIIQKKILSWRRWTCCSTSNNSINPV